MTRDEYEARQADLDDQIAVLVSQKDDIEMLLAKLRSEKINLVYTRWREPIPDTAPLACSEQ